MSIVFETLLVCYCGYVSSLFFFLGFSSFPFEASSLVFLFFLVSSSSSDSGFSLPALLLFVFLVVGLFDLSLESS